MASLRHSCPRQWLCMIGCALLAWSGLGAVEAPMRPSWRVFVAGYDPIITCLRLDRSSGVLRFESSSPGGVAPSYLAWSPDHRFLYAINESSPGRVVAFRIDPANGRLTRIDDQPVGGSSPAHLSVHPDGRWVFVADFGSGNVAVLPVRADGGLLAPVTSPRAGRNAHMVLISPDGRLLFVPCRGSDAIAQYLFSPTDGRLQPLRPPMAPLWTGAGPRHLAFHPGGRFAYAIDELDSTVAWFTFDREHGRLTLAGHISSLPPGIASVGNTGAQIAIAPNGRFLYASNRGHDSISIFAITPSTGSLRMIGDETGRGHIKVPRDFTLSPDGRFLLVASQDAGIVTAFAIGTNGLLEDLGDTRVPPHPSFVGIMP